MSCTTKRGKKKTERQPNRISSCFLCSKSTSEPDIKSDKEKTVSAHVHPHETHAKMATNTSSDTVCLADLKDLILKSTENLAKKIDNTTSSVEKVGKKIVDMENKFDSFNEKLDELTRENDDLKISLNFVTSQMEELQDAKEKMYGLTREAEALKAEQHYQEYRSRKYNLLIYGLQEQAREDTEMVVRNFIKENLKMANKEADICIANTHRLPKISSFSDGTQRLNAIIVKCLRLKDRNSVLDAARNLEKGCRISIRTDLPSHMKKKRSELAKTAYNLRKEDSCMTRIKETAADVWLEFKRNKNSNWQKYTY